MRIGITGTPGTGKTSIAKEMSRISGIKLVDLELFLKKCEIGFDEKRGSRIIDEKKLSRLFNIKGGFVVESHLAHFLRNLDVCIVLVCGIRELKKRLEKRGWKKEKINENLEAERMKICLGEAMDRKQNILVYDTTGKKAEEVAKEILKKI